MKEKLLAVLEKFCPGNVFLQGTIDSNAEYPESFCTFWTNYVDNDAFYDNNETRAEWNFTVIYYSADPAKVNSIPAQIRTALKSAGFIPQGRGNDIVSDVVTHTGWAMEFTKIQDL